MIMKKKRFRIKSKPSILGSIYYVVQKRFFIFWIDTDFFFRDEKGAINYIEKINKYC